MDNTLLPGDQETRLTFEDVLSLLQVESLPFLDTPQLKGFAIKSTQDILKRHDKAWVTEHRARLIKELEQVAEM